MTQPNLQPHQQRVVEEKDELDTKLGKLRAFFDTQTFLSLPEDERRRLMRQSVVMTEYSTILGERITGFTNAAQTS